MRTVSFPGLVLICLVLGLVGCNAETTSTVDLGSVSIGTQLIDLKKAHDAGAITGSEYQKLKNDLLTLVGDVNSEDTAQQETPTEPESDQQETDNDDDDDDDHDDDDDSGFLF